MSKTNQVFKKNLKEFDDLHGKHVLPIVEGLKEKNPHIEEGIGNEEDIGLYKKTGYVWWPPVRLYFGLGVGLVEDLQELIRRPHAYELFVYSSHESERHIRSFGNNMIAKAIRTLLQYQWQNKQETSEHHAAVPGKTVGRGAPKTLNTEESQVIETQERAISAETTLFYDKHTGKFCFNGIKSLAVSKTKNNRVRRIAEKFMDYWEKGKPCPQSEIDPDPAKKTPQSVYDGISTIRDVLVNIGVNMPRKVGEAYLFPEEPRHFIRLSKRLD
ncbi:MAG: hypothetical protein ACYSWY_10180 [Planctomycetota bacterium]